MDGSSNDKIKIEKGVPVPRRGNGGINAVAAALHTMEIGDSIVTTKQPSGSMSWVGARSNRKFTSRREGEGYRVWRVS